MLSVLKLVDYDYDSELVKAITGNYDQLTNDAGLTIENYNKFNDAYNDIEFNYEDDEYHEYMTSLYMDAFNAALNSYYEVLIPVTEDLKIGIESVKEVEEEQDKTFGLSKKVNKRVERIIKNMNKTKEHILLSTYGLNEELSNELIEFIGENVSEESLSKDLSEYECDISQLTQECIEAVWQNGGYMTYLADTYRIILGDYNDEY